MDIDKEEEPLNTGSTQNNAQNNAQTKINKIDKTQTSYNETTRLISLLTETMQPMREKLEESMPSVANRIFTTRPANTNTSSSEQTALEQPSAGSSDPRKKK